MYNLIDPDTLEKEAYFLIIGTCIKQIVEISVLGIRDYVQINEVPGKLRSR